MSEHPSFSSDTETPTLQDLRIHGTGSREKTTRPGRIITFGTGAALILLSVVVYIGSSSHATRVQVTRVQRLPALSQQGLLTATGYIVAQRQAAVASKSTGSLTAIHVDVGDLVTKGDILATLEQADVKADFLQAQARLGVAKAMLTNTRVELREATLHYQRIEALRRQGLVTRAELDAAEARLRRAQASVRSSRSSVKLAQAEQQAVQVEVDNTLIRAPFDGTVIKKYAEVGEIVAPMAGAAQSRSSVVAIADLRTLYVEAEVSESFLDSVVLGQPARVALEAVPGHVYHGSVSRIVPTADRTKATIPVNIRINDLDDKVLPDMSATVTFLQHGSPTSSPDVPSDTLVVSPNAIVTRRGQTMILLARDNVVTEVPVETGAPVNGLIPIRGDVAQGNTVIVNPSDDLVAGSIVQEQPQD